MLLRKPPRVSFIVIYPLSFLIASYSFQPQADATALDDRLQFIEQAVDLFWFARGPKAQGPIGFL
jgi:hypothetical protein